MTLRISLRDGEKVVINGAVIRASGRTDLAIESKVTILRGREIMSPAEASTPARALYFHTMMAYLDPERIEEHHARIVETLQSVTRMLPCEQARVASRQFAQRAAAADYYRALGDCRALMRLEHDALAEVAEVAEAAA
jgi:flagellar biosynthesis repressor protein FlbT